MEKGKVHLIVRGRVQGVFFRSSTREMAYSLGLTGWVRNMPDGSVEAVFEGPKDILKEAVKWCYKGPPGAAVRQVDEKWLEYSGEYSQFEIRYF